jgi:hypothetical protein
MGNAQLTSPLARALVLCSLLFAGSVHAEEALEEVVVTGEQPGPGLWKVTNGEHALWILGTHSPLPKKMEWRAREVEAVIARSQTVIAPADVHAGIGFFTGLRLLPTAMRAASIPDDGTLATLLPAPLYARWMVQSARYSLPGRIERMRPAIAALALGKKAMDAEQLSDRDVIWPVVQKLAKRHDVVIRQPAVNLDINDPKGLLNDYARMDPSLEADCLDAVVTQIEHDLPRLRSQANAWATGNIGPLRAVRVEPAATRCRDAMAGSRRLVALLEKAQRQIQLELLLAWEGALQRDVSALAVAPIPELLGDDGLLNELRKRGYQVIEPE